ncbi:mannan-binding protein [Sphingomonas sp. Sphisp140]|uniref:mannan-binding protein n=1 Tax=Sphingomonas sp. Sphisp140 TaxID=3243019 RepID=UPI0039B0E593
MIRDIEVGPIWNQRDAETKCRDKARDLRAEWTGNWHTTAQGRQSVCSIRFRR